MHLPTAIMVKEELFTTFSLCPSGGSFSPIENFFCKFQSIGLASKSLTKRVCNFLSTVLLPCLPLLEF